MKPSAPPRFRCPQPTGSNSWPLPPSFWRAAPVNISNRFSINASSPPRRRPPPSQPINSWPLPHRLYHYLIFSRSSRRSS
ncbi:actin-related protein 4 isoform X1 [Iris pallida]|uniref:Actin-related protein 4 isoform X1 n=1 Tax=Iris pallida TaxID=29817 RepID=A0AAX6GTM2_IRIPA|nr:actin-related protein 4 isoform X1 [Iris pallida]